MKPVIFPEVNSHLGAPQEWDNEQNGECQTLPVFTNGEMCVSLWTLTLKERIQLLLTGRLWAFVYSGSTQPPIAFSFDSTVFSPSEDE